MEIRIRGEVITVHEQDLVHLEITDTGTSLGQKTISALFARRQDGMGSLHDTGLNWCANVMAGLHGRIYAQNAGLGHGTCLHLEFPVWVDDAN